MNVRPRRVASWALALLAGLALTVAVGLAYANAALFSSDGFSARVDRALRTDAVSAAVARRLTDEAIGARPDLVAVRPVIESAAQGIVRGEAFRSLVRGAARDVHRSVFDRHAGTFTLAVSDAGVLLAEALEHVRPDVAQRIPASLRASLAGASGTLDTTALHAAELGQRVRAGALIALAAALLLGFAAVLVSPSRRVAALRLGVAVAAFSGLALLATELTPRALAGSAAGRAVLVTWLHPLVAWYAGLLAAAAVVALTAASYLRPVEVVPLLRRAAGTSHTHVRAAAAIAAGVTLVLWPRVLLDLVGALLVLAGVSELLRLAGDPAPVPAPARPRRRRRLRVPRRVVLAGVLVALVTVAAVVAGGGAATLPRVGRCNGSADLCDRTLDQVAFVGTHNSMAAEGEPGWLFAAQDAGIPAQLGDGVRALLIDTHYGFATPRGVATDLTDESTSREKVVSELGERFVETAERLRTRIGYEGGGTREVFLCHAFCEVGATRALPALEGVHRFLVTHPEEVLILSIEDDTTPADTAALIRDSGLIREVYLGPARPPWPTLREMVDRDERVLVLIENHPGPEPWMHSQSAVAQETPFHFSTPAELAAPDSCRPNRGGTAGSLLLVNHWVDTSPAPRVTIAREVNAAKFLDTRLARCQAERRLLPTILAVDFYREGDVFGAVRRLNDRVTPSG